jgi:hypothetical protein
LKICEASESCCGQKRWRVNLVPGKFVTWPRRPQPRDLAQQDWIGPGREEPGSAMTIVSKTETFHGREGEENCQNEIDRETLVSKGD